MLKEADMEFLTYSMFCTMLETHREILRRYGDTDIASQTIVVKKSHYFERTLTALGEMLIQVGTRLKAYSYRKAVSQEPSAPTFMIML